MQISIDCMLDSMWSTHIDTV